MPQDNDESEMQSQGTLTPQQELHWVDPASFDLIHTISSEPKKRKPCCSNTFGGHAIIVVMLYFERGCSERCLSQ